MRRTIDSSVANFLKLQSSLLSLPIREFKKLRLLLQRKRHFKIELCVRLTVSHFRLLCTNGFHGKAKNEIFIAAGWRCRQSLK